MALPGAIVVDFDGTANLHDIGVCLGERFSDPSWTELAAAYERGELTYREWLLGENAMLEGTLEEMVEFVLDHCPMDPTFAPFVAWTRDESIPISIASDGSGFHIAPLLGTVGLQDVSVLTNEHLFGPDRRHAGMAFPNGHPECVGCGTCKMKAVLDAREATGSVAFVGDGVSDRYGALYADVVFAKGALPAYCEANDVIYRKWGDFNDVRKSLETDPLNGNGPGPIGCPGWITP